jgi:hypothetical protein
LLLCNRDIDELDTQEYSSINTYFNNLNNNDKKDAGKNEHYIEVGGGRGKVPQIITGRDSWTFSVDGEYFCICIVDFYETRSFT